MKLAFVDNLPVGGGLSRFSYMLCKSLVEHYREWHIDYFVHHENLKRTPELLQLKERVSVKLLHSTQPATPVARMARRITNRVIKPKPGADVIQAEIIARVKEYDLAYFPSAHMMPLPALDVPVVGTLHDFNWRYFFGRQIFSLPFVKTMDEEVVKWMTQCKTVCSSHDVITEARKLYPHVSAYPTVVHIAPVIFTSSIPEEKTKQVLAGLSIDYPYLIFPGNFFPHKNHLNLFSAFSLLRKRKGFGKFKLILTGMNTDQVPYGIAERNGICLVNQGEPFDVRGLGYQPNEVIDSLIAGARLLVSPSLYEAICTPGMDAWNFGVPTAISDIPPFREHEEVWGVRSAFFDPMDPVNMADVLENYLNNYDQAIADGHVSRTNMARYTWKQVADGYMNVFKEALRK